MDKGISPSVTQLLEPPSTQKYKKCLHRSGATSLFGRSLYVFGLFSDIIQQVTLHLHLFLRHIRKAIGAALKLYITMWQWYRNKINVMTQQTVSLRSNTNKVSENLSWHYGSSSDPHCQPKPSTRWISHTLEKCYHHSTTEKSRDNETEELHASEWFTLYLQIGRMCMH